MQLLLSCAGVLLLVSGCSKASSDLVCPTPQSGVAAGSLQETPEQIAKAGQRLGTGSQNEISEVVGALRGHHPSASHGEIVNYLVTAYCPRIKADTGLDLAGKQNALKSFAARAEAIAGKP